MAIVAERARTGNTERVGAFFVVLPDREEASAVARRVEAVASHIHRHASGRPWLAGRWADSEFLLAREGTARLALLGSFGPGASARAGDPDSAASVPGSFYVVSSHDGQVRVRGNACGSRPLYHARAGGTTVVASRADILAALSGATLDETQVAIRLLEILPHPLAQAPLWRGVQPVEPGRWLRLDRHGTVRESVWWTAPVPDQPLETASARVRTALIDAVNARTGAGGVVTCDLSGGMDSTAMTFLAAAGPVKVVARTLAGNDPANTDVTWARRAAAHLPEVEHLVVDKEDWPLRYAALETFDDVLDEPTISILGRAELSRFYFPLAENGGRVHLTGIGGDHVTWCGPTHYHDLLLRRPLLAVPRLRAYRALHHWPLGETLRALADRRPYQKWLSAAADRLHAPPPELEWTLGWGSPPRLPGWVTPDAAESIRRAMKRAAETARPLAPKRGPHVEIAAIRDGGRWLRQIEQLCARGGLSLQAPFFDDEVIHACLSVRPEDRVTPFRYRPVLQAALRGIVPDECLERSTKDVFSLPASRALAEHRDFLLDLWDGSRLAALGIVDEKRLRAAISSSMTHVEQNPLDVTISVEIWLRTLGRAEGSYPC